MTPKSRFVELFSTFDLSIQKPEWKTIGSLGKILTGSTPKTNVPEYWDGDIKWIAPAELTKNSFYIYDTERKITEEGRKSCSLNVLKPGVVLLSSRAPIGKVAIVGSEMYCNQGFKNIECGPELDNVYLYMLLKYNSEYLNSLGRGATFKEISTKIVAEIKIPTPPLELQKQFTDFVKQVDKSKIRIHQLIKSYDTLVKSRFVEEFGNIQTNSKGWKTNKLGSLATFKTGGTPSSKHPEYYEGTIPFISTPALGPNYIDETSAKYNITEAAINSCATTLIPAGSLIVGTRINVGKSSINTVDLCTNQDIVSLMDVSKKYKLLFLKHCIDQYIPYLDSQKKGATIKGITTELLKSISIPEPPIEQQKSYVDFVKQVDKSKFAERSTSYPGYASA